MNLKDKSNKKGSTKKQEPDEFKQALFLLKICYSKIVKILDVVTRGYIVVKNPTINHYYTILNSLIDGTLKTKELKDLKNKKPELPDSLIGNLEDIDTYWEYHGRREANNYLGMIEKLYILTSSPTFKIPEELQTFLDKTDEAIEEHKIYHDQQWKRMEGTLDKQTEDLKNQWDKYVAKPKEKDAPQKPHDEPITKIECVQHQANNNKLIVIINENYNLPLEVTLRPYWSQFYELAEKQRTTNNRGFYDYFSSNKNNPIFKNKGYKITKLVKKDGAASIVPKISIEIITTKKYNQRKKKTT